MNKGGKLKRNIALIIAFAAVSACFSGCMKAATVGFDVMTVSYAESMAKSVAVIADVEVTASPTFAVDETEPEPIFVENIDFPDASATDMPTFTPDASTPVPTATPAATPSPTASPTPKPTPSPSPTISVNPIDNKDGYIYAKSANLRKGPDTSYDIIGEYQQYEELTVTGESGEWYRVKIDGERGYMLSEFIEFGAAPTPTPSPTPKPTQTPKPTLTPEPTSQATPSQTASANIPSGNGFSEEELYLLAQLVHREANGTSLEAQRAVANTIYNRVMSGRFPSTVEGVIFQKNQYSPAKDESKLRSTVPSQTSIDAVISIFVNGELLLPANVTFFKSASSGTTWSSISFLEYYTTVGSNAFFEDTRDR